MSKLFCYLFSAHDANTVCPIFTYVGVAGAPIAIYLISSCGTPVDILLEDASDLKLASSSSNSNSRSSSTLTSSGSIDSKLHGRVVLTHSNPGSDPNPDPNSDPNLNGNDIGIIGIADDSLRAKSPTRGRSRRQSIKKTTDPTSDPTCKSTGTGDLISVLKGMRTAGNTMDSNPLAIDQNKEVSQALFGFNRMRDNALMLCCIPKIAIFRKHRQLYDTLHMMWHFASALGPIASTWLAYTYHYSKLVDPQQLNDGVLGYGYFDPYTKCFPIVPIVSLVCSVILNIWGNMSGIMPMD